MEIKPKKKKKWKKPQLVILAKGKLGENVLNPCGFINGQIIDLSGFTS